MEAAFKVRLTIPVMVSHSVQDVSDSIECVANLNATGWSEGLRMSFQCQIKIAMCNSPIAPIATESRGSEGFIDALRDGILCPCIVNHRKQALNTKVRLSRRSRRI